MQKFNSNNILSKRIPIELKKIHTLPKEHGITCYPKDDSDFSILEAIIIGPKDSPYENGTFKLSIDVGEQYPFRPPTFKFVTKIFHPNIDTSGKICLDVLRMPPGSYNPTLTLESILISIQLLLTSANPDDPLHSEAAELYKTNRDEYNRIASEFTKKYAVEEILEHNCPQKRMRLQ